MLWVFVCVRKEGRKGSYECMTEGRKGRKEGKKEGRKVIR
jgi:hypothetical protein